jgi:hypothetical protein
LHINQLQSLHAATAAAAVTVMASRCSHGCHYCL